VSPVRYELGYYIPEYDILLFDSCLEFPAMDEVHKSSYSEDNFPINIEISPHNLFKRETGDFHKYAA
jgi:hypothetical protein